MFLFFQFLRHSGPLQIRTVQVIQDTMKILILKPLRQQTTPKHNLLPWKTQEEAHIVDYKKQLNPMHKNLSIFLQKYLVIRSLKI